jgi:hypothetical protein
MPMKSDKQRRAMHAAASGKSNIGIPKQVAKQFVRDSSARGVSQPQPQQIQQQPKQQSPELQMAMMEAMRRGR